MRFSLLLHALQLLQCLALQLAYRYISIGNIQNFQMENSCWYVKMAKLQDNFIPTSRCHAV